MRTSILGATFLLAGAGAALVAAAEPGGSNIALNGSDTLFDVTGAVIASCKVQFSDPTLSGITYQGGGSGVGAGAQGLDTQEVAPSSRAYKNTEYCAIPQVGADAPSTAQSASILVGIDGVAISANTLNSCSSSVANGFGASAAMAVTSDGTTTGGAPATCPGCDGSNNYTFANSFDALKVLYFGQHHDSTTAPTYDCASPVRKTLVRQWKNLFSTDCATGDSTCGGGLTHAWRRSDLSGTTDAFVSVLNPPGRGIGTLPSVPTGSAQKVNPFCNTVDANTNVVSFGGSGDFSDKDPIRTICAGEDSVCEATRFVAPLVNNSGDMGVVLPILMPDAAVSLPSDFYPLPACGTSCANVAPAKSSAIPPGFKCPLGPLTLGKCLMPTISAANPDPRCISNATNKCFGVTGKPDGRVYNNIVVVNKTQFISSSRGATPFQFSADANGRLLTGSYYRMHQTTPAATFVADLSGGNPAGTCQENDDTSQIGCLTDSDPCSAGFAGREAAKIYPGKISAPLKALAVNGTPPFTPGGDPDLALKNLLQPTGTTPLYPLSRRLYVTTIYGFNRLAGGEKELASCYAANSIVTTAISNNGFVPIPGGVQCLDYPEQNASTSSPAPNVQGTGNVALPGCGAPACTAMLNQADCTLEGCTWDSVMLKCTGGSAAGHNACADTVPGACGDGLVEQAFGEQCDPPAGSGSGSCDANCKLVP